VLGGNGSSEVRVWSMGGTTLGKYPKLGQIVEEFADRAKASPGTGEEFGDDRKELIVEAEKNISLFLNHYMYAVEMDGTVIDALPNSQFTVRLDNGHELLAYTGGRMRRFRIRILLGDRVQVQMSPYDLTRGRVSYRYR